MALPGTLTDDGNDIVQNALFDKFKTFKLEDEDGEFYYSGELSSVYFDEVGVLSMAIDIPQSEVLDNINKYIRIFDDDDVELCNVETSPISFTYGVGGEIVIKFDFTENPGEIIFINGDWVSNGAFNDFYLFSKDKFEITDNSLKQLEDSLEITDNNVTKNSGDISKISDIIDDTKDTISTIQDNIKTNSDNISTLKEDVSTNSDNIKTNGESISTLQEDVSTNSDNIKTNSDDIKTNSDDIKTNSDDIKTNSDDIKTNSDDIKTNSDNIKTNSDNIKTNSDDIKTLKEDVSTNSDDIKTLKEDVSTNSDDIKTLKEDVSTNSDNIDINNTEISKRLYFKDRKIFTIVDDVETRQLIGTFFKKWLDEDAVVESYDYILADVSSSALTITLPESPSDFDEIKVFDAEGNSDLMNITIDGNGNTIDGDDSDTIDEKKALATFIFYQGDWKRG